MKSVLISILLLSNFAWAKTNFKKQVDLIESKILSEVKKHKISKKREYYLYLLASREYMQISYSEKAKEYLNKALNIDVEVNKFEILVNLISLNWQDKEKVKSYYPQLVKEYKSGGKKLMRFDPYISGVKAYINGEKLDKNHPWTSGVYGYSFIEENYRKLIEQKKFKEALAQINPAKAKDSAQVSMPVYELLQAHVFGQAKEPTTCVQMMKKYPKASGYTSQLCRVVLAYHSKDKAKLKAAKEKAISVINKRKKYNKDHLLVAVKELQL